MIRGVVHVLDGANIATLAYMTNAIVMDLKTNYKLMNAISYSLFGYNQTNEGCADFRSYLRGLHLNIRIAELLYPGWQVVVLIDKETYHSPYFNYIFKLDHDKKAFVGVSDKADLCTMMLWRMIPLTWIDIKGNHIYDRVICRDTDSLLSYRERQAVAYWERGPKMAHAITDSVSHTITLMGGMIGFQSGPFRDRMGVKAFDELLSLSQGIDFNNKGADQDFLNRNVLPKVADSITEHFVLGHPQTFRGDCHNFIHDIDLKEIGVPDELKETNGYGFHIGAAGFQTDAVVKFLQKHGKDNEYWEGLEKQYPECFYWML
jgi:hypothetical protein